MPKKYKTIPASGNNKIYIGMPRERILIPAFVDNRDHLLGHLQESGRGCGYYQAEGHRVDRNRDMIVKKFMEHPDKPEWLVMIDTDMEHPIDLPMRLTRWRKPIVGGLYFYRGATHEPFAFMRAPDKKDDYGRMIRQWSPIREPVYQFLLRNSAPIRDGALAIGNPQGDPLLECDAVATGAIAIHRSVFETMQLPVFEYRNLGASEDLTFCDEAKYKYGIPIYCDLSTISGHYHWQPMGYVQFMQLHEGRGIKYTQYTLPEAAELLAEYEKIPVDIARAKIQAGNAHMVGDYWNAVFKDTTPMNFQVDNFYKDEFTGKLYIIELLHWNGSPGFTQMRHGFKKIRHKKILEIGSGIGTLAIQLALQMNKVTACEINSYTQGFAKLRARKIKEMVDDMPRINFVDNLNSEKVASYDTVFAIDVFEHLGAEPLYQMLRNLNHLLKPEGRLIYHANFKQQDLYPMHFNYSPVWVGWLKECGFTPIGPYEAVKTKEIADVDSELIKRNGDNGRGNTEGTGTASTVETPTPTPEGREPESNGATSGSGASTSERIVEQAM